MSLTPPPPSPQVKKFLESSCNLPDFVERYRTLYLRLKNAMEELFGQQTAFVLALRHGFSAALLQLSILRAMHVSPGPGPGPRWVKVGPADGCSLCR